MLIWLGDFLNYCTAESIEKSTLLLNTRLPMNSYCLLYNHLLFKNLSSN